MRARPDDLIRDAWITLEGTNDVIQLTVPRPPYISKEDTRGFYTTLKEALLQSLVRTFQVNEDEIDGFITPNPANDSFNLVIHEVEEGGVARA